MTQPLIERWNATSFASFKDTYDDDYSVVDAFKWLSAVCYKVG